MRDLVIEPSFLSETSKDLNKVLTDGKDKYISFGDGDASHLRLRNRHEVLDHKRRPSQLTCIFVIMLSDCIPCAPQRSEIDRAIDCVC